MPSRGKGAGLDWMQRSTSNFEQREMQIPRLLGVEEPHSLIAWKINTDPVPVADVPQSKTALAAAVMARTIGTIGAGKWTRLVTTSFGNRVVVWRRTSRKPKLAQSPPRLAAL